MTTEYEFEPSVAMLLVMRVAAQRIAAQAEQDKLPDIAKAAYRRSDELGKKARKLLREHGYEPDCEIDMDMNVMATKAQDMIGELGFYISVNSHKVADFLSKHGDNSLREWQDSHPTPIRPDRRN